MQRSYCREVRTNNIVYKNLLLTQESIDQMELIIIYRSFNHSHAVLFYRGIVDFMLERKESNLDKSYTPPAPLMTMTQQKIVTLLVDLEIRLPTVIKWVQAGIEYKLFRLNNAPTVCDCEY